MDNLNKVKVKWENGNYNSLFRLKISIKTCMEKGFSSFNDFQVSLELTLIIKITVRWVLYAIEFDKGEDNDLWFDLHGNA